MPSPQTLHALYQGAIADRLPDWLAKASADDLQRLHALCAQAQMSRTALEKAARALPQYEAYARNALIRLLTEADEPHADPATTVLYWVSPNPDQPPLTCTLLQAALRNFSEDDTLPGAFGPGSGLYRDSAGTVTLDPAKRLALEPWAFARACRKANLGAGYAAALAARLPAQLLVTSDPAGTSLPRRFAEADRDALRAEACIARLKGELNTVGEAMLANWGVAGAGVSPLPARAWGLRLAGFELGRVLVISAGQGSPGGRACILYIPNDPHSPLRQFDNADAMTAHLHERLGHPAYLRFIAGFVGLEHEQVFIRAVEGPPVDDFSHLYATITNPLQALELAVRLIEHQPPFPRAAVAPGYLPVENLFSERYASWARQALANTAVLVVPTARIDRAVAQARHQRWVALGEQLGLLVLSFIPGVGQAVGVYSMVQLLHTVFDASRALGRGDEHLARALLLGAAENAGTLTLAPDRPGVDETEAFAARLQLISHPDGRSRFWLPDMHLLGSEVSPRHMGPPSSDGIVRVGEQAWVRMGERYVPVAADVTPWQARVLAPEGYRGVLPRLLSNGRGGWRGEYEQSEAWSAETLVRRGGTEAQGLDESDLSLALRLAHVQVADLHGAASRGEPLPGLLRFLLQRRAGVRSLDQVIERLGRQQNWPAAHPTIVRTLSHLPGWPEAMGVELAWLDGQTTALHPAALRSVRLEASAFTQGDWLAALVSQLSTEDLAPMIGDWSNLEAARQGLAERWVQVLEHQRASIVDSWGRTAPMPAEAAPVARQFPTLPAQVLDELLRACDSRQLARLRQGRVPLAVAELAAAAQRDVRLSLACEALADGTPTADRDALLTGLLPQLEGWPQGLAIELHSHGTDARLLHRAGPATGSTLSIERDPNGAYTEVGQPSIGADTLEAIVGRAVTRADQGLEIAPWNAPALRSRLLELALTRRPMLRRLLGMAPDTRPLFRAPSRLAEGRLGYPLSGRGALPSVTDVIARLLRQLYPDTDYVTLQTLRREVGEGSAALEELARRHTEVNALRLQLGSWLAGHEGAAQASAIAQTAREVAAAALIHGWQRRHVATQAQVSDGPVRHSLSLRHLHVGESLPALTISFPHVLELDLTDMNLEYVTPAFLALFPNARVLSLSGNPLRELPRGPAWLNQLREVHLRDMGGHTAGAVLDWLVPCEGTLQTLDLSDNAGIPSTGLLERLPRFTWLRELDLDNNALELTEQCQGAFTSLTNLVSLSLDRNPLGLAPSVQGLSRLRWLSIADARLQALPAGLEQLMGAPELRLTYINLAGNRISHLPDLSATEFIRRARLSDNRGTLLYFNLDGNPLDDAAVAQLDQAGLEFEHAAQTADQSDLWLEGCPEPLRQRILQAREAPGAESFFQVLSEVVRTAPYVRARTPAERQEVAGRAWALAERFVPSVIPAQPGITELRDRLYDMATEARATCGDGVVLTLDQFEGEVAVWQALTVPSEGGGVTALRNAAVVARRQFRQALLDAQAQRLVRAREARLRGEEVADPASDLADDLPMEQLHMGVDEVELRLVLRQRLRGELDLPPASERLYEALVSESTMRAITGQVRTVDTGDAFAQWLVDHQQTWRSALERQYAAEFEHAREPYDEALAHVLALAAGEAITQPLSSTALAALEAFEPEVQWRLPAGGPGLPALSEQQAYVLGNGLNLRCNRAMEALRLRLTLGLIGQP